MRQRGIFEKVPGSGEWWIRYADPVGRIRYEKVGGYDSAKVRYERRKDEVREGSWRERRQRRRVLFREIATDALAYADQHKRSRRNDHSRMRKLRAWFGERPADSITPTEIEDRFETDKWSAATWNRYRALLSLAYRLAIRAGKAKGNPARLVRHKTENNARVRFLSPAEEQNLRKVIREKFPEHEPELDVALQTGLRQGEQYSALWKDVNFERRILTVPLDKGGKTSHVPLNGKALRALADLYEQHGQTEFVCGGARSPRHWFESGLEAAGITDFTWHDLRHTFASRLVMSGADIRTVAELLRDKTLAMVMRYAHVAPDHKLAAVERMASSFFLGPTETKLKPGPEQPVGTGTRMVQ